MTDEQVYQPLLPELLKQITDSIDVGCDLVIVTLVYGDVIIGGLEKRWSWNGEYIRIGFNTKAGTRFGSSHILVIPLNLIANISLFPLADESIPHIPDDDPHLTFLRELGLGDKTHTKLYVQDYPNPLATIIAEHNLEVCSTRKLGVMVFVENALSREIIPPEGIKLSRDFILYADWEFFSRQIHGPVTVSGSILMAGVAKDISPSLQTYVFKHLRENFQKIKEVQDALEPGGIDEIYIQGCILNPEPRQDTEIEGEHCILIYCANAKNIGEAAYSVLIKQKSLKFPIELLNLIRSPLIFYGELLPIPNDVFGKKHEYMILARAIGYLQ